MKQKFKVQSFKILFVLNIYTLLRNFIEYEFLFIEFLQIYT